MSPTRNINIFISINNVLALTNKHGKNVSSHMMFYTHKFVLKKQFKDLFSVKLLETGY